MSFFAFTRSKDPTGILNELLVDVLEQLYALGAYGDGVVYTPPAQLSGNVLKMASSIQSPEYGAFPFEGSITPMLNRRIDIELNVCVPLEVRYNVLTNVKTAFIQRYQMYDDVNAIYVDPLPAFSEVHTLRAHSDSMNWSGDLRIHLIGSSANAPANLDPNGTFLGLDSTVNVLGFGFETWMDITH